MDSTPGKRNRQVQPATTTPLQSATPPPPPPSSLNTSSSDADADASSSSVQVAVRVRPFLPNEAGSNRCVHVLPGPSGPNRSAWGDTSSDFSGSPYDVSIASPAGWQQRLRNSNHPHHPSPGAPAAAASQPYVPGSQAVRIGGESGPTFSFDRALPGSASQRAVYQACVSPLVRSCLRGYNATTLAYGQTGSGKTYTILGPSSSAPVEGEDEADDCGSVGGESVGGSSIGGESLCAAESSAGVIPRALRELFAKLEEQRRGAAVAEARRSSEGGAVPPTPSPAPRRRGPKNPDGTPPPFEYDVRVQFLELYGEEIRDLLSPNGPNNKLTIRDGGNGLEPEVIGATETTVHNAEEALLCLTRGMLRRVTGATAMNSESSRSHAIMSVVVEQTTTTVQGLSGGGEDGDEGQNIEVEVKRSKFNFVDLAGSERQKRTNAEGKRLKEGIDINKGLLVLGNVISALGDPKKRGKTFVPYRDSKLTRLLKGSLGGNHKTLMIACVSPSSVNMEESLNCLRYANRAKNIQNNAVVNVDAGSRLVAELRGQVKLLASELLVRVSKEEEEEGATAARGPFSAQILKSLASGADSSGLPLPPPNEGGGGRSMPGSGRRAAAGTPTRLPPSEEDSGMQLSDEELQEAQQRAEEADAELDRMRESLRRANRELYSTSEELYAVKAEREYFRIQVTGDDGDQDGFPATGDGSVDGIARDVEKEVTGEEVAKSVFIEKMASYEKEIASLIKALTEAQTSTAKDDALHSLHLPFSPGVPTGKDWKPRPSVIERANEVLENEKSQLSTLQLALQKQKNEGRLEPCLEGKTLSDAVESLSDAAQPKLQHKLSSFPLVLKDPTKHASDLDAEEEAEHDELANITNSYLSESDNEMDEDNADVAEYSDSESAHIIHAAEKNEEFHQRQQSMDAYLVELTKSISAKEELIEQLNLSQNKYETMREFYEVKLMQMETQVKEREAEREHLVIELQKLEESNSCTKDLQIRLGQKEQHINDLRKKQRELLSLTKVSSGNDSVIARLSQDIAAMKRQKVELQRQRASERKLHAAEIQRLRKEAMQRGRDASKYKKQLDRKSTEAENAQRMAKTRLEEVGKLRSKYREAEKKLRMQTLKRGVMAKAGLDPVLIGRREPLSSSTRGSNVAGGGARKRKNGSKKTSSYVDNDSMRRYFDGKISDVSRKEAAADKLAHEWEHHLELTWRREELLKSVGENNRGSIKEELDALNVEIQYKEERIRRLARRIGDKPLQSSKTGDASQETFLSEKEFKSICSGASSLSAAQAASKLLFGMVVRERRRVASLARTASALDKKAVDAEIIAAAKDAALISHMEEQRHERASMAQNQQEQILSLMAMVKEEEKGGDRSDANSPRIATASPTSSEVNEGVIRTKPESAHDSMVLILANERVSVLERQLAELQGEREAKDIYKAKEAQSKAALDKKTKECESLQREVRHLRSSLRQIQETVSHPPSLEREEADIAENKHAVLESNEGQNDEVVDQAGKARNPKKQVGDTVTSLVQEALHPTRPQKKKNRNEGRRSLNTELDEEASPALFSNSLSNLIPSSESEDEDAPDWAGDIMADLALIAEGEMPPSLMKHGKPPTMYRKSSSTVSSLNASSHGEKIPKSGTTPGGNVFDRLTDPDNFTGVQKQKVSKQDRHQRLSSFDHSSSNVSESKGSDAGFRVRKSPMSESRKYQHKDKSRELGEPDSNSSLDSFNHGESSSDISPHSIPNPPLSTNDIKVPSPKVSGGTKCSALPEFRSEQQNEPEQNSSFGTPSPLGQQSSNRSAFEASRSVFERLQSPSNYTGTQKTVAHDKAHPKSIRKSDLTQYRNSPTNISLTGEEAPSPDIQSNSETPEVSSTSKVADYTSQNVFDRLNKTTTQAYAVKHQPSIARHSIDSEGASSEVDRSTHGTRPQTESCDSSGETSRQAHKSRSHVEGTLGTPEEYTEYTSQNVFERLQKTTTQSYAGKHPLPSRLGSDHDDLCTSPGGRPMQSPRSHGEGEI